MDLCFADSHMHAYAPFDKGQSGLNLLKKLNVTDANLLAYTYIETGIDNNLCCLYYKQKCTDVKLRVFGGLYYDADLNNSIMPFKEQAELLLAMGCDGIKFLDLKPNYQLYCGCTCDDAVYDDLYDMLEEKQVPIVTHVADPRNFWTDVDVPEYRKQLGWCYSDPKFLTRKQINDCLLHRLEKNPTMRFQIAHFGFMSDDIPLCRYILERYPNVTFDLAPGWEILVDFADNIDAWSEFFSEFSGRILYGTDTDPGTSPEHITTLNKTIYSLLAYGKDAFPIPVKPDSFMRGMDLPEDKVKQIVYDNFFTDFGSSVKALDFDLFKEHSVLIRRIAVKQGNTGITNTIDEMLNGLQ